MPVIFGPKPSEYFDCPPTLTVNSVRPWKLLSAAMISYFSVPKRSNATRRASLKAASLASAPELQKNAR